MAKSKPSDTDAPPALAPAAAGETIEQRLDRIEKLLAAVVDENGRNGSRCADLEKAVADLKGK